MAPGETHVYEEDVVHYWIFPDLTGECDELEKLESFKTRCFTFLSELSGNYIWHEDSITLRAIQQSTSSLGKMPSISFDYCTLSWAICAV